MAGLLLRALVVLGVLGATSVGVLGRAEAACHAWTVSASPSSVAEGGKVTVTVTRDAAVNPSSVHVTTVDGSAKAPGDYTKLDQQVSMTSETSKTLTVTTRDDATPEGAETFKVHLHDGGGCAVNSDFEYGPDAVVSIKASDPATPAPARRTQAPTNRPAAPQAVVSAAPTLSPTLSPAPSPTASVSASPEATMAPQAGEETAGGLPGVAIAAIVVGAIALASAGGLLWYRRRGA
jgi:hypothetical protein